jgi:pSer/pThr/pTyr-binding forkhead associated (FHA) protein
MKKSGEDAPVLVAHTGPLNGQRWTILRPTIVGRDPQCDIVIADRQVSRQHARLSPSQQGILIEDLNSKNGTHYNGQPLSAPQLLQDGDVIQIALAQQFVFLSSDATLPLEVDDLEQRPFLERGEPVGRLRLEKRSRRVWIGGEEDLPPLSVAQFALLEILYDKSGQVISREMLSSAIWGDTEALEVSMQALDALVRRLRERLYSLNPDHHYIVTVRGHGLRLDNP